MQSVMGALGFLRKIAKKEVPPEKVKIDDDQLETVYSVVEDPYRYHNSFN